MDHDMDGTVNFEDFVVLMSMLSRGTFEEKLQWVFNLYDFDGNGSFTLEDMLEISTSVQEMLGKSTEPSIYDRGLQDYVFNIFTVGYLVMSSS